MTQTEIKKLASEMVGDGKHPNMFFVTKAPYIIINSDLEIMEGYVDSDSETYGPFNSYNEALECFNETELDITLGTGQIFIEDRLVGTIKEKFLVEEVTITHYEDEYDYYDINDYK